MAQDRDTDRFFYRLEGAGILAAVGPDGRDFLQRMTTADMRALAAGHVLKTLLLTEKGRMIDLLMILPEAEELRIVTSPGAGERVSAYLNRFIIMEDLAIRPAPEPHALLVLRSGGGETAADPAALPGVTRGTVSLGGGSFDLMISDRDPGPDLKGFGYREMSREEFERYRVVHAIPAYGHEIHDQFNPLEAGLGAEISFTKGCYVGQEVIARLDTYKKVHRRLTTVQVSDLGEIQEPIPLHTNGTMAGFLTTLIPESRAGKGIGLAILEQTLSAAGTVLHAQRGEMNFSLTALDFGEHKP